jgi:hypothetical protein
MNRRGFFQTIIAGITALCLPRRKKAEKFVGSKDNILVFDTAEEMNKNYDEIMEVFKDETSFVIYDCLLYPRALQREISTLYLAGQQWEDVGTNYRYVTIQVKENPNAEGNEST